MSTKNALFVVFVLALAHYIIALPCDEYQTSKIFTCNNTNLSRVNVFNFQMDCPPNTLCNANYLYPNNICSPCLTTLYLCGTKFSCVDASTVKMGETTMKCPKNHHCNTDKANTCLPCIEETCDKDLWTCDPNNNKVVIIDGIRQDCVGQSVCNSNYKPPCLPCVVPHYNGSTFFEPNWP